jgi:hypothetical protein
MNGPTMTPEIERLLTRYLQIQDEMRRLDEEKTALNDRLCTHLTQFPGPFWFPTVGGQALKIRVRHDEHFVYNEELLRQRLGERYAQILKADPAKVRRHLGEIEDLLRPALGLVGTPNRERVRTAVEAGVVPRDAFTGAFEKTSCTTVAVMRLRDDDRAGGQRPGALRTPATPPGRPAGPPGWQGTATGQPPPRPPAVPKGNAPGAAA